MKIPHYYTPEYYAEIESEQAEKSREKSAAWDKPKTKAESAHKRYNFWRSFFPGRTMSISEYE